MYFDFLVGPYSNMEEAHTAASLQGVINMQIWIKFTLYLLTTMPMEGRVKCLSPQNT